MHPALKARQQAVKSYLEEVTPKEKPTEVGINKNGVYKTFSRPACKVKKITYIKKEKLTEYFFMDKYNKLHNYRRADDKIMLYYNKDTEDLVIIAVLNGDDLTKEPFCFNQGFIVNETNMDRLLPDKGLVKITNENLKMLAEKEIIEKKDIPVLLFNKNNVGFYL